MRISTQEERRKQRYNRQENALNKYAQGHDFEYVLVFREDASGKNFTNRKQWASLERSLQPGDTVVFKNISRFTREAETGYEKYMTLLHNIRVLYADAFGGNQGNTVTARAIRHSRVKGLKKGFIC